MTGAGSLLWYGGRVSDSDEDLREEVARMRAANAHLFLAVDALARCTFGMFNMFPADEATRTKLDAEVRANAERLQDTMLKARSLIWD